MQTYIWPPHSVVLVTCMPFAVYVVRIGIEGPLATRLARNDGANVPISFSEDVVTGDLIVSREGLLPASTPIVIPATNLAPNPALVPCLALYPSPTLDPNPALFPGPSLFPGEAPTIRVKRT